MEGGRKTPALAPLVLASSSPRRRQILEQLGMAFEAIRPQVDEDAVGGGSPAEVATARARAKAESVARLLAARGRDPDGGRGRLILGVDTLVARCGRIYGKPAGPAEAEAMLAALCGRPHDVWSGIALVGPQARWESAERTRVWLRALRPEEIAAYVATGEPLDKAGAYAAQGRGATLVERVSGCFWNVVGLPVAALCRGLEACGRPLWP